MVGEEVTGCSSVKLRPAGGRSGWSWWLEQVEHNAGGAALYAQGLYRGVSSNSSPLVVDLSEALGQAEVGNRDPVQGSVERPVATRAGR
jgi:hypothetical protein